MIKIHKALKTNRFNLNPLGREDALKLANLNADPDVAKNLICDWSTAEQRIETARSWIESGQDHGIWGIYDRENRFNMPEQFVGYIAIEEPLPKGGRGPEIYYALGKQAWGSGVATEVVKNVVTHLFDDQGVEAVDALVLAGLNPASSRLLQKLGMVLIGRYSLAEYAGDECLPTIAYEIWRVENALPENTRKTLEEAAFKIGQFVSEDVVAKDEMAVALLNASVVIEESTREIIDEYLEAGMNEAGWLHFSMKPDEFVRD